MLNEPVSRKTLQEFSLTTTNPFVSYSELAHQYYATKLLEKLKPARESEDPAIKALAEVVEFLVDTYEKGNL